MWSEVQKLAALGCWWLGEAMHGRREVVSFSLKQEELIYLMVGTAFATC